MGLQVLALQLGTDVVQFERRTELETHVLHHHVTREQHERLAVDLLQQDRKFRSLLRPTPFVHVRVCGRGRGKLRVAGRLRRCSEPPHPPTTCTATPTSAALRSWNSLQNEALLRALIDILCSCSYVQLGMLALVGLALHQNYLDLSIVPAF